MLHNACMPLALTSVFILILNVIALSQMKQAVRSWRQAAAMWQGIAIRRGAIVEPRDVIKAD